METEAPHRAVKDKSDIHIVLCDLLSKHRYSQAWKQAMTHYEKNHNTMSNSEIYLLCFVVYKTATKKMKAYLRNKRTFLLTDHQDLFAAVAKTFVDYDEFVYLELAAYDKNFFGMLNMIKQPILLRRISKDAAEEKVFVRKNERTYLKNRDARKMITTYFRQMLKLLLLHLQAAVLKNSSGKSLIDTFLEAQLLFHKFQSRHYPFELLEFEILKMRYLERDPLYKECLKPEYYFPLSCIHAVYKLANGFNLRKTEHYAELVIEYLLLCIRNCEIPVQELFTVCSETTRLLEYVEKKTQQQKLGQIKNGYVFSMARKSSAEPKEGRKKSQTSGMKYHHHRANFLYTLGQILRQIEQHHHSRLELQHIISVYMPDAEKWRGEKDPRDEPIQAEVILQAHTKKDLAEGDRRHEYSERFKLKRSVSLGAQLPKTLKGKAKLTAKYEEGEEGYKKPSKREDKFILKNIRNIVSLKVTESKDKLALAREIVQESRGDFELLYESEEDEVNYRFQEKRRATILMISRNCRRPQESSGKSIPLLPSTAVGSQEAEKEHEQPHAKKWAISSFQFTLKEENRISVESLKLRSNVSKDLSAVLREKCPKVKETIDLEKEQLDYLNREDRNHARPPRDIKGLMKMPKAGPKLRLTLQSRGKMQEISSYALPQLAHQREEERSGVRLSGRFDHLRRDVAKHQFEGTCAKYPNECPKITTIFEEADTI